MAILFTLLLGSAVIILGYFGYYFNRNSFIQGTEAVIDTEMRYLSHQSVENLPAMLERPVKGRVYLLLDKNNQKIQGNLAVLPKDLLVLSEGIVLFDAGQPSKKYAAKILTFPNQKKLLVGVNITKAYNDSRMMQALSAVSIILMLVVIGVSFVISTFVVGRTRYIARIAHDIMRTGNLSQRIEMDSAWDDLSYMAQVLNGLFQKIEELMDNVRQVSDNIAHDLRTPLTRLRNRLEGLHAQLVERQDTGLIELSETLTDEADHILNTFFALLRIARIEAGQQKSGFGQIQLDQIVKDVADLYEPLAEEKSIAFNVHVVPARYHGDRDLMFQAVANLVDNAIKFTPPGGSVSVTLDADRTLTVTDSGPGIAAEDRQQVFQRFYRTEASRHTPGNGLGLSLVAAVVALHGGKIILGDGSPGLRVKINL